MNNPAPLWFRPLNVFVTTAFACIFFFLLTNGIPLIELGIIPPLKSKMRYLLFNRIAIPILTLVLLSIYFKSKETFSNLSLVRWINSLSQRHLYSCAAALVIIYGTISTVTGFTRHAALETRAFDLGIFAQAVWNTLQGDFLFSSLKEDICLLGDHMSPILALLLPFYALWHDPRTLIIVQAFTMAGCLFMITKIAEHKTGDRFIAFCFLVIYFFLSPPKGTLREDFHPEVLAEPVLMLAFFFLERGKIALWAVACLLAASAKENIWGIVFMMSLYAAAFKKQRLAGISMAACSLAAFLISIKIAIPAISAKNYLYEGFYLHLLKNPGALINVFMSGETWEYLIKIFSPTAFLAFCAPAQILLAAPIFVQNILSNNPVFRSLSYHYTTGLIPFVMISAVYGLSNISRRFNWRASTTRMAACLITVLSLLLTSHSEYYFAWKSRQNITPHKAMIREKLNRIPSGQRVLTHNSLVPQFSNRKFIYQFEHNASPTKIESAITRRADIVVIEKEFLEPGTLSLEETLDKLRAGGYVIDFKEDGFYILRKSEL